MKIGGDAGGGTFKINFQIVNILSPNSPQNTCVFAIFEAKDTTTNLQVALDRFQGDIRCSEWDSVEVSLRSHQLAMMYLT